MTEIHELENGNKFSNFLMITYDIVGLKESDRISVKCNVLITSH